MKPWKHALQKSIIKCFKKVKVNKWPDLSYSFRPIDYCVRIKPQALRFIKWWYSVIDILIVTASISKLLYPWLFIDISEHHYTTQTLKFNNRLNRASTMLNNVFKIKKRLVSCTHVVLQSASSWRDRCLLSITEVTKYRGSLVRPVNRITFSGARGHIMFHSDNADKVPQLVFITGDYVNRTWKIDWEALSLWTKTNGTNCSLT